MKQVVVKQGSVVVEDTPAPVLEPGTILVKVLHSCISVGTEMSGVKMSGAPLWKRALKQPDNVRKVVTMAASQGITKTRSVIKGKLEAGNATGYSACGVIVEVGEGIKDLEVGDIVACAGAQCAHHAELIRVPRNLSVKVPQTVTSSHASTVTLGAIALQGVRRATPSLGETFVVLGLGVLGQLAVQMLRANGCKVIALDLDPQRVKVAMEHGADYGLSNEEPLPNDAVYRITDGIGADGVIVTAATPSNEVLSTAFKMCRKKGRVVLVGDVGMDINRADIYKKELDFFISTSYGPGRYDDRYEEDGLDYPVSYVRWTENRNMMAYLSMIERREIRLEDIIHKTYPLEDAKTAYDALKNDASKPLMLLLEYNNNDDGKIYCRKIENLNALPFSKSNINIGLIGAGGFAKGVHLPNIQNSKIGFLYAVASRTGHNAIATAKQFGAEFGTSDYKELLDSPEVDAVVITTGHDTHGKMVLDALNANKHVLVEKPLALEAGELVEIERFYQGSEEQEKPVLLTGFNRRFSKYAREIHRLVSQRQGPLIISYRMNAGYIPLEHWVHGKVGGGRNRGEACHIYDLFIYLTGAKVESIKVEAISPKTAHYSKSDNFNVIMSFEDGSTANLIYTALGSKKYPKENLEVFFDEKVIKLDDYKNIEYYGCKGKSLTSNIPEKGHAEELSAFLDVIKNGGDWPIPLWQQIQATEIANKVEEFLGQ